MKLEEQIKLLKVQVNATDTKHHQVEQLLQKQSSEIIEPKLNDYFEKDEDEADENVLFLNDDGDEMKEILNDMPELLMQYIDDKDVNAISEMTVYLKKIASILLRYTPFLDPLAQSFEELSYTISNNNDEFIRLLEEDPDSTMKLFDAISIDIERYVERFSVESMAMKNIHHIHHPTTLSIMQIVGMISPESIDEGEIDFF